MSPQTRERVLIAADHAGFELKEKLKSARPDIDWVDLGPFDSERVDYPDYATKVSAEIVKGGGRGVLICGSGQGMAIRANRYRGIRAALVWNEETARLSREHNDANILCLGARFTEIAAAKKYFDLFLSTPFEGGRHLGRVTKLDNDPGGTC